MPRSTLASPDESYVSHQWMAARLHDWPDGTGPMYVRLADATRRLLDGGDIQLGARLPAERQLATVLRVSRTTVAAAYDLLAERGVVRRRHGSGTYVQRVAEVTPSPPRESVLMRSLERNEIFDGLLDPPRQLLDFRAAALVDTDPIPPAALDGLGQELAMSSASHGYVPAGLAALRAAVAERYTASGLPTTPEQVLITSGAQQAIAIVSMLHVRGDDTIITEELTHTGAIDVFGAAGASIATVPVDGDGADIDAIAAALSRNPKMLYLIPSIHNPIGGVMPARSRRRLAALLGDHPQVIAISDDTLADTFRDRRPPAPLATFPGGENVLHIGSLSKLFWAGLRIGWVRGPATAIRRLARLKALSDLGTSIPSQLLALRLLALGEPYEESRRDMLAARGRALESRLRHRLPEWTFSAPEGGVCLWIRLPSRTGADLAMAASRHGIALAPGSIQSPDRTFANCIRLPYGYPVEVLDDAVDRLALAWSRLLRGGGPGAPLDEMCVVV